jgi:peptidoglycan/xylan/chitin deacetylase (PgdA/CDA1 family)
VASILGVFVFILLPSAVLLWVASVFRDEYRGGRIPILCYHRLISKADAEAGRVPDDEMIWVVYDQTFAEQMNWLQANGWTTLDLDDLVAIRSGQRTCPHKALAITFDDGYLSNYTLAYPSLAKHGQKATIFVALEPDQHSRELVDGIDDWLTPEQMRERSGGGVSFQSHTMTHCILP